MLSASQADRKIVDEALAIAVAGVAGSGKTTLGRLLARDLGAPMLDLDTLTNPLLDSMAGASGQHWMTLWNNDEVRAGRYAALKAAAHECLESVPAVVMVAPFTAELQGGAEWDDLRTAVGPATLLVVQLVGDPELFAARRRDRGEDRDRFRPADRPPPAATEIPVVEVDAALSTDHQAMKVWEALGDKVSSETVAMT